MRKGIRNGLAAVAAVASLYALQHLVHDAILTKDVIRFADRDKSGDLDDRERAYVFDTVGYDYDSGNMPLVIDLPLKLKQRDLAIETARLTSSSGDSEESHETHPFRD